MLQFKPKLRLVLASSSKQRQALFRQYGLDFEVVVPAIDETALPEESIVEYGSRIAQAKALKGAEGQKNCLVIAADTCAALHGKIYGKPKDFAEAQRFLNELTLEPHSVYTFVAIRDLSTPLPSLLAWFERTEVEFFPYPASVYAHKNIIKESLSLSGGYSLEKAAGFLTKGIQGSYSNVLGFPIEAFLHRAWLKGWIEIV